LKVPFFDYSRVYATEKVYTEPVLLDVLNRSDFILRDDVFKFEAEMANFLNAKYVVSCANGTDAIWLGLWAIGIKPGDEVILSTHTYVATADAVNLLGAIPVVVDIENDHSISTDGVKAAMTKKTKGVIATNLNGHAARLPELKTLCEENGIWLAEDNAQGLGAKIDDKFSGSFGIFSTLSFFPAKTFGCYGDGGALVTDSKEIAEKVIELRNHGRGLTMEVAGWGVNSRLDNIQAAVLSVKLKRLDECFAKRRDLARTYTNGLIELKGVSIPYTFEDNSRYFDVYQNYEISVDKRDELRTYLSEKGIGTLLPWSGKALHHMKLSNCDYRETPTAEKLFKNVLMLPMNQYLEKKEIDYVVISIRDFYQGN
jgi:dTDP-4-amino-4,6-dideoxygalactose transaminase